MKKADLEIRLGSIVQDKASGFLGRVVSHTVYPYTSAVFGVQGFTKGPTDNVLPETYFFQEEQLFLKSIRKTKK